MARQLTIIQHVCQFCNNSFRRKKRSERKRRFCSVACANMAQKQSLVHSTCLHCGAPFTRSKSRMGMYCSDTCSRTRPVAKGVEHWNWNGGISKRARAVGAASQRKVRAVGRCERCGSTENLHGHHIEHFASAPEMGADLANIEVLCSHCHAFEHPKIKNLIMRPPIRDGKEITCLICGRSRYANPCQVARAKYCSRACLTIARLNGHVRVRPRAGKELTCTHCGKLHYVKPHDADKVKFCSWDCYKQSRGHEKPVRSNLPL